MDLSNYETVRRYKPYSRTPPLFGNKCSPCYLDLHLDFLTLTLINLCASLREYRNNLQTQPTLACLLLYNWKTNTTYIETQPHPQRKFQSQIWESVFWCLAIDQTDCLKLHFTLAVSSVITHAADNKKWLVNHKLQNLRMRFLLYITTFYSPILDLLNLFN